jgi:hypothetical protein
MHFMSALIAPRALVVLEGFYTFRGNPEGQYLCFLAADEVYKLLGAEKYNGIKMYKLPHSYTNYERFDIVDFAKAYFAGQTPNRKFREPPFPANDPRSREDYATLDWARPGARPLSERIEDPSYVYDHAMP